MRLTERQLLDALARMPFADTLALAVILGEAYATVHRALSGLLADGIAGRVNHGTVHLPTSGRWFLTTDGIAEAADQLGFAAPSEFVRAYRRLFASLSSGVPPSAGSTRSRSVRPNAGAAYQDLGNTVRHDLEKPVRKVLHCREIATEHFRGKAFAALRDAVDGRLLPEGLARPRLDDDRKGCRGTMLPQSAIRIDTEPQLEPVWIQFRLQLHKVEESGARTHLLTIKAMRIELARDLLVLLTATVEPAFSGLAALAQDQVHSQGAHAAPHVTR